MKTLLSLTILAALACPMYAVDGVVLINQSSALAGNVTPGDTPGFPVTISVSGSYRLSGNLTVPDANTDAIDIDVDNVTIDLNGFSIIGPTVCSGGPPVASCSPNGTGLGISSLNGGISVSNGTIRGMGAGIAINSYNNRIVNVATLGNSDTGIFVRGIVSSCTASNNGGIGILTFGSKIVDNVTAFNHLDGIQSQGPGLVSGNLTFQNGNAGIHASACPSFIVMNAAFGNASANIATSGSGCVLVNNDAP
jgi:hypothetical protein